MSGHREVAADSGYAEPDDYDDGDLETFDPRDYTCGVCSGSLTNCPHGRSDFDPVAAFEAEFQRLITGQQEEPSPAMDRIMRAVLGDQ